MTIDEAQKLKASLEARIARELAAFSESTGLEVDYMAIDHTIRTFGEPAQYLVRVDVEL
jgi:hypothetical protein